MTFGTRRWWGCQPHAPAPLPQGMFLVLIFTRGWVDPRVMVRSEGDVSLKNPVIPPGIDPGTVRLVAQRLNHYAIPGPISEYLLILLLLLSSLLFYLFFNHLVCLFSMQSGDRIPVAARFSAPVQTGLGVHPTSCTMVTRFLSRG
jgi:hypothetical protein